MIIHVRVSHPEPWHTVNEVTHTSSTPCKTPVPVLVRTSSGTVVVRVDCGRRLPAEQQCPACRHIRIIESETPLQQPVQPVAVDNARRVA